MVEPNEDVIGESEHDSLEHEKETNKELLLETSDTLFDMLIESDFLESLPFIRIGYATLRLAKSIQNKRFYTKVHTLLNEIHNRRISQAQIKDFQEKVNNPTASGGGFFVERIALNWMDRTLPVPRPGRQCSA